MLSTPIPLFYQSSFPVFLTCKFLPRSTMWSQYMITLNILIIVPRPYSQCTCIAFHKKFSNWGNLSFHITATLPAPPWKPCFHVLSFKAFSEFLLSYWSTPTSLFITKPGFWAFSLPYKALFLPFLLCRECPASTNQIIYFSFSSTIYMSQNTKIMYQSESRWKATPEREMFHQSI